jgi:hypothetical protein
MVYLVLGMAVLALGLMALRGFAQANPANVARRLRIGGGTVALLSAGLLLMRGLEVIAIPLGMFGSWLIWGRTLPPWLGGGGNARRTPGQVSRVETDHLEMELDHDTGEMHGRVLKGMFAGRDISTLSPTDLGLLWQDCRHVDPQSAQLVEAYLDRIHPTWREDMARGESDMSRGPDGRMAEDEALDILGLKPGASEEAIRKAHRELMLKLHPDRGGSTYLAAKINEAKDVALDALKR